MSEREAVAKALHENGFECMPQRNCAMEDHEADAGPVLAALKEQGWVLTRAPSNDNRLVEMSPALFEGGLALRAHDGKALSVDWGQPTDGVYEPTFTVTDDGMVLTPLDGLEELRALSEAATPGPWCFVGDQWNGDIYGPDRERDCVAVDHEGLAGCVRIAGDGHFIVKAVAYVRSALDRASSRRKETP